MSLIESLKARVAAAEMARDAAVAAFTAEDVAERALRAELAAAEAARVAAEKDKRDIDLARRLDAMRDAMGDDVRLRDVVLKEYPEHSFILRHVPQAYARFEKEVQSIANGKKLEVADVRRAYVVASIVDWNGLTDFSVTSPNGGELLAFLKKYQGVVSLLANEASELAGLAKEERKSGG